MDLSVIIATYNRCESLKDTLGSLLNQQITNGLSYEIIIADNNSKDRTREVAESYKTRFNGKLKYLFEPRQGKPYALNKGIQEAAGEIIAFTDDDCVVDTKWLINIKCTFDEYGGKIGIIGGRVLPLWLTDNRPKWIIGRFMGALGILDWGNEVLLFNDCEKSFFGNNMAFRASLFRKYGYFDEKMFHAQDTEICHRYLKNGINGLYNPQIQVSHKILNSRITPNYFYKWFYERGKLFNHIEKKDLESKFYYPFGIPIWIIRRFLATFIKSLSTFSMYHRIYYKSRSYFYLGRMASLIKDAR